MSFLLIEYIQKDKNMIKHIILSLAKKYIIGFVNDLIKNYYTESLQSKLRYWIKNLKLTVELFEKVENRLSDSELTNEELEDTKKDLDILLENFKDEI